MSSPLSLFITASKYSINRHISCGTNYICPQTKHESLCTDVITMKLILCCRQNLLQHTPQFGNNVMILKTSVIVSHHSYRNVTKCHNKSEQNEMVIYRPGYRMVSAIGHQSTFSPAKLTSESPIFLGFHRGGGGLGGGRFPTFVNLKCSRVQN